MRFYDLYIRFLVWLGAAPPPGYEYLLTKDKNMDSPLPDRIESAPPSSSKMEEDEQIAEEDLPDWLKD